MNAVLVSLSPDEAKGVLALLARIDEIGSDDPIVKPAREFARRLKQATRCSPSSLGAAIAALVEASGVSEATARHACRHAAGIPESVGAMLDYESLSGRLVKLAHEVGEEGPGSTAHRFALDFTHAFLSGQRAALEVSHAS